ncbi:TPA: glycosyltransferase [Vibrio vulnificus]|uniref:glycosyltransferase n=1 Tax=Vibrio vulnificus TaxID=672 RepID=UPI001A2273B2|nr:glycosyltransferase [Vibrio vulnificus]HAS8348766.1 glycosyltransferase [Vibrio vulnificus]HAS8510735.1 glycosyltransferase [Vibrio vulnificus]HDY7606493.1 glycosyltransferase [Vibrio vulnificus]HDY7829252.1 glycosyltransferase [Vibrio vulnificus]
METLDDVVAVIFTYKQQEYIEDSIRSMFEQSVFARKLIIIDDCSPDETQKVICEVVADKPEDLEVELRFSPQNLGLIGQINALKGEFEENTLLIFLAGDDIALPTRTEKLYKRWIKEGRPHVINSSYIDMIDKNELLSLHSVANSKPRTIENIIDRKIGLGGCTQVISSSVLNDFPAMSKSIFAEDRVFILRGFLLGGLSVEDEPLLHYRVNVGISNTARNNEREILESERGYLLKELGDLSQNLVDAKHVSNGKVVALLEKRKRYIQVILDNVFDKTWENKWAFLLSMLFSVDSKYLPSLLRRRKKIKKLRADVW